MAKNRHTVEYELNQARVMLDGRGYVLAGVKPWITTKLALEGLVARLKRSPDPRKAYQEIIAGNLDRQKRYPEIVQHLAERKDLSLERAKAYWDSWDKEQRKAVRAMLRQPDWEDFFPPDNEQEPGP